MHGRSNACGFAGSSRVAVTTNKPTIGIRRSIVVQTSNGALGVGAIRNDNAICKVGRSATGGTRVATGGLSMRIADASHTRNVRVTGDGTTVRPRVAVGKSIGLGMDKATGALNTCVRKGDELAIGKGIATSMSKRGNNFDCCKTAKLCSADGVKLGSVKTSVAIGKGMSLGNGTRNVFTGTNNDGIAIGNNNDVRISGTSAGPCTTVHTRSNIIGVGIGLSDDKGTMKDLSGGIGVGKGLTMAANTIGTISGGNALSRVGLKLAASSSALRNIICGTFPSRKGGTKRLAFGNRTGLFLTGNTT